MTNTSIAERTRSPEIIVGREQHRRLVALAIRGIERDSADADWLLSELERAHVVPDGSIPDDVVRMGSTVRFRTTDGAERSVQLVFPGEADIEAGRISVLTPVGAALVGLRTGQSITWLTRDGRKQALTVLETSGPDALSE